MNKTALKVGPIWNRVGNFFRRPVDPSKINQFSPNLADSHTWQKFRAAPELRGAREQAIREAGKDKLLGKIRAARKPAGGVPPVTPPAPGAIKPAAGIGRKLMIGGGLLAAGATMAGGVSAARERAQQPLASPQSVPPGY